MNPAFILGNGPTLPADLSCLDGLFTVGVNRIFEVYEPIVLMWMDTPVYREFGEKIDACHSLLICNRQLAQRLQHIGLATWPGTQGSPTPVDLCNNGNTGCCAARWALALGCKPVYLVGMSGECVDGRANFYGNNPHHLPGTQESFRTELVRLKDEHGGDARQITDCAALRAVAENLDRRSRNAWREFVCETLDAYDVIPSSLRGQSFPPEACSP